MCVFAIIIRSQVTRTVHSVWSTPNNALHVVMTNAQKYVTQYGGDVSRKLSVSGHMFKLEITVWSACAAVPFHSVN